MSRQLKSAKKPPFNPPLPSLDHISVLHAQLFDNTNLPSVKGMSDYALKIKAHTKGWGIDLKTPDWWRTIQLICPKLVLAWATAKHVAGGMTDEQFAVYKGAAEPAIERLDDEAFRLIRMGHIGSPPGNQYYVGQFVLVLAAAGDDGPVHVIVFNNGESRDLGPSRKSRSKSRLPKPGLPPFYFLHDPADLLGKQYREKEALKARHDAGMGASNGP